MDELADGNEGILYVGERAPKRSCHNIVTKEQLVRAINKEDLRRLEEVLRVYRDSTINKNNSKEYTFYAAYEKMKKAGKIPIYYDIQQEQLYLSFAALGRKAFARSLDAMYGEKAHQKCTGRNNLCPTCTVFGTVEGDKMGSRIRVTDAKCEDFDEEKQLIRNVTFAELASPKISYVPFYLQQKEADANFEREYDSVDLKLRGRKFYWHHKPKIKSAKPMRKTERNGTFDIVCPNTRFEFRVYFDGITEEQLNLLEASIHLNENDVDGIYCHKIGRGKPLGYGSVKMVVKECVVREFDTLQGWQEISKHVVCKEDTYMCSQDTWQAFRSITNLNAFADVSGVKVEYPSVSVGRLSKEEREGLRGRNAIAAHQWFSQNYAVGKKTPEQMLPMVGDEQRMQKYDILQRNKIY